MYFAPKSEHRKKKFPEFLFCSWCTTDWNLVEVRLTNLYGTATPTLW